MGNQKGMTLIELIVALAVCAIFIMSAVAIISPVTRTYERTQESSDAQMVAESMLEEIRAAGTVAANVTAVNGNVIKVDSKLIQMDDAGYLTIDENPVFDEKFYGGKTAVMKVSQVEDQDNCVEVTLCLLDTGGRELFTVTTTVKPIA